MNRVFVPLSIAAAFCATAAQAELKISNAPTAHMSCSAGVCTATRGAATLNIGDLVALLNAADLEVATGTASTDIHIADALSWTSTHKLTLDAPQGSIVVTAPVSDQGGGALEFDRAGQSPCTGKGKVEFWDTATDFKIDGYQVTLAASVADLGRLEGDNVALAKDYDAAADGAYNRAPVDIFEGRFDGLCNSIRNLKIVSHDSELGLFGELLGEVTNVRLEKIYVKGYGNSDVGGLAGHSSALITNTIVNGRVTAAPASRVGMIAGNLSGELDEVTASGKVTIRHASGPVGGLVGRMSDFALIHRSASSVKVSGGTLAHVGGLAGEMGSGQKIESSFAEGTAITGAGGLAGGLVGSCDSGGSIENAYAAGTTQGGLNTTVGGLIGLNKCDVRTSYASGAVASGSGNAVGGFVGNDAGEPDLTDDYFDITTSGQSHGAGNDTGDTGITGLTTEQFQAGLPSGFDPAIWAEAPGINGGLPYLRAVKP